MFGQRQQGQEEQAQRDARDAVLDDVEAHSGRQFEAQHAHQREHHEQHAVLHAAVHRGVEIHRLDDAEAQVLVGEEVALGWPHRGDARQSARQVERRPGGVEAVAPNIVAVRQKAPVEARMRPGGSDLDLGAVAHRHRREALGAAQGQREGEAPAVLGLRQGAEQPRLDQPVVGARAQVDGGLAHVAGCPCQRRFSHPARVGDADGKGGALQLQFSEAGAQLRQVERREAACRSHVHVEHGRLEDAPPPHLVAGVHAQFQALRHHHHRGGLVVPILRGQWNQDHRASDALALPPRRGDAVDGLVVVGAALVDDAAHQRQGNHQHGDERADENEAQGVCETGGVQADVHGRLLWRLRRKSSGSLCHRTVRCRF